MTHSCLVCQKHITWQFAICSICEKKYGNVMTQWPDWLRYLWADTQRERRRDKRQRNFEVPFYLSSRSYEDTYDID